MKKCIGMLSVTLFLHASWAIAFNASNLTSTKMLNYKTGCLMCHYKRAIPRTIVPKKKDSNPNKKIIK